MPPRRATAAAAAVSSQSPMRPVKRLRRSPLGDAAPRSQVANGYADDDGEEYEEEEEEEEDENTNAVPKREMHFDDDNEDEQAAEREEEAIRQPAVASEPLQRHERDPVDEYLPGSIVRVNLHNFVTYDDVEFRPGPYLNMIIGPNGTGKSTISCAICLCLGHKPALLGRATEMSSFVKQGHKDGFTELELKGLPGEGNYTIRRYLSLEKQQAAKVFTLNGKPSNAKTISELMETLRIQIDNLCSFLPQDKVTEFARMSPSKLLLETEKASTGGDALYARHLRLIDHAKGLRELLKDLRKSKEELGALTAATSRLENDAARHKRRQELEDRSRVLDAVVKVVKYRDALRVTRSIEKQREKCMKRVMAWDAKRNPFQLRIEKAQERVSKAQLHLKKNETERQKMVAHIKQVQGNFDKTDSQREKLEFDLQNLAKSEARRQSKIEQLRASIAELEETVGNPPEDTDMRENSRRRQELDDQLASLRREEADLMNELSSLQLDNRRKEMARENIRKKVDKLNNQTNVKMQHLRNSDENAYRAVLWLEENKSMFQGRIYLPPMLEVEIDQRYKHLSDSVEMAIRWGTLKTFVCEKRSDYDLLTATLNDKMKLRVNVAEIEGVTTEEVQRSMIVPPEELRKMGFDGYIIDFLKGPQTVLNFLCSTDQLHKIPLAEQERNLDRAAVEQKFSRFIVGDTLQQVKISNYAGASGKRQVQTSTRVATRARNLVFHVDTEGLAILQREDAEFVDALRLSAQSAQELKEKMQPIQAKISDIKAARDELYQERQRVVDAKRRYEAVVMELKSRKDQLVKEQNAPSLEGQRDQIRQRLTLLTDRMAVASQDLAQRLTGLVKSHQISTEYKLRLLQAEADATHLSQVCDDIDADARTLQEEVSLCSAQVKEAKRQARHLTKDVERAMANFPDHLRGELEKMHQEGLPSVDQLEDERMHVEVELEGAPTVSSDVIRRYQEKLEQRDVLETKVSELDLQRERLERKVDKYRANWEPLLEQLIERVNDRFADAFDQFQCTGEVRLAKPTPPTNLGGEEAEQAAQDAALSFEEYTVEIRVKFRQEEELQLLTAERQSGGERSLSTILYLMSLTELSAAPFSLVDEINQGMDQRAERLVHDHMVRTTCRQAAGQYFLITPKLLTGLEYHEKMRMLIINAGDYVPERFSFKDFVAPAPQRQAVAA